MQVVPATHVPEPVHPCPAHCEYLGSVPATAEVVTGAVEAVVEVDNVVPGGDVVVGAAELEELTTTPPGPATEVVREPFSTYTPLK